MTQAMDKTEVNRYLPFGVPDGAVRMFCLPHAGGSASAYRSWFGRIGGVAVCPLQPPGRETRLRDTPHTRMASLVDDLAEVVLDNQDGPFAVYGHSLGALVGFELLRELRRRGGPDPVHFFVSGCPAPDYLAPSDGPPVGGMDDAQIVGLLRRLGGTPEWMLSDATVLRMILPPFRADFAVKETYGYQPESPLDTPITAIAGSHDTRGGVVSMAGWRHQTSRYFQSHTLIGGHFAVLEQPATTHRYISEALRLAQVPAARGPVAVGGGWGGSR